jgi:2-polyprenyl-6-methoxyphenol hydroxylase-like FAD-dependent oxidoreductase
MKACFQSSFPCTAWDEIITNHAEWDRFAKANGTTYPMPQYSPGSAHISPHNPNLGNVLVRDACHAFPPNIGQGINSGLNDVVALDQALQGQDIVTGRPIAASAESN